MSNLVRVLTLLALMGVSSQAFAHPHVWVSTRAQVVLVGGYLDKVQVTWSFDELFTSLVLMDNDANSDGQLSSAEVANVRRTYFDNLKGYDYFAHLSLGKRSLPVTVTEFNATITAAGNAVYTFVIPVGQRLDTKTAFSFAFYDESFYTDMVFEKQEPVRLEVTEGGKANFLIKPNPAKAFYGGQVVPIEAVVSWRPS
jgi:ABC-type uncharacterized transport system substrate-binding protein